MLSRHLLLAESASFRFHSSNHMKNKLLFGGALSVFCGLALPAVSVTSRAADRTAVVAPDRLPADLARADRGTRLEVRGKMAEAAQVLIGKDATAGYTLPAGTTSMILALSKIEIINHFDFVTAGAAGKITVSVASTKLPFESTDWREVVAAQAFAGNQLIPCDLGSIDARYVKLDFSTSTVGQISGFNLIGATAAPAAKSKGEFHVTVATPSNAAVEGSVTFDAANPAPKIVADLGTDHALNRLTCTYEAPAGTLDLYLVDDMNVPAGQIAVGLNYVGEPSLQPVSNAGTAPADRVLAGKQPIYSLHTADAPGSGQVSADLGKREGHYLVAAFRPAARHRAGDGKDGDVSGKDYSKGKDVKDAPVFPFATGPAAFGQPPTGTGTPLVPPAFNVPSNRAASQ